MQQPPIFDFPFSLFGQRLGTRLLKKYQDEGDFHNLIKNKVLIKRPEAQDTVLSKTGSSRLVFA
jgi:hypothetical protein